MKDRYRLILAGIIAIAYILILLVCEVCKADEIDDIIPYIIQIESGGNAYAVSKDGCIGLMQISNTVFEEWNYSQPDEGGVIIEGADAIFLFNPKHNKKIGEWYLRRLKNYYLKDNYTIERMLASYNGGITRLKKCNYDISKMPRETREYIRKIMKLYRANAK